MRYAVTVRIPVEGQPVRHYLTFDYPGQGRFTADPDEAAEVRSRRKAEGWRDLVNAFRPHLKARLAIRGKKETELKG